MFTHIIYLLLSLPLIFILYFYIIYRIRVYKAYKLGVPVAFTQFISYSIPYLPQLLKQRVTYDTAYDIGKECFERTGAPIVAWVDGVDGLGVEVRDPDLIKKIVVTKAKSFTKPVEFYGVLDILGSNILTTNGEVWEKHRRLVGPHFSLEKHLRKIHSSSVMHAHTMFQLWEKENFVVCAKNFFRNYTLDIIGSAAFGYEVNAMRDLKLEDFPKDQIPPGVTMTMNKIFQNILNAALFYYIFGRNILKWLPFQWAKDIDNSSTELIAYIDFLMNKVNADRETERHDLLSLMIRDGGLSDQEIKANTFIFFVAGHETTATTLTWAMYELARNPHVQKKLFEEVDSVLQGRDPTYEDLDKLVYTTWVWKETLRYHPPVQSIPKKTTESIKLGNLKLKKNQYIGLNAGAVHMHEKYWDNPKEFRPERFDESTNKIAPFSFLPFSLGKRNCVGERFAMIEGRVALAMIAQRFEVQFMQGIATEKYFEESSVITTIPKHDLKLVFIPRKSQ